MKLTKMNALGLVALVGLALNATPVYAEVVGSETTEAKITIEKGGTEGATGALSLDSVSGFNFGKIKLGSAISKDAEVTEGQDLGVKVTDLRGEGEGWNLTAKISDLKGVDTPANILKAKISIPAGKITTTEPDGMLSPATSSAVVLNASEATVMGAQEKHGLGTWSNNFNADGKNVSISIPSNAYIDTYKGDITWSLKNAPQ